MKNLIRLNPAKPILTIAIVAALLTAFPGQQQKIPTGTIVMWSGDPEKIPAGGWVLCDGTKNTPDLRDRFIVGAGNEYQVGDTGGKAKTEHYHDINGNTRGITAGPSWYATATRTEPVELENRPPYYALAFIMKVEEVHLCFIR